MDATEQYLLERWSARRDCDAFAELAARHAGMVFATCRRILGNPTEAEDIAQDCFLELARSSGRIRTSLAGWLHALAVSRCVNHMRTTRRRQERERKYAAAASPAAEVTWDEIQPLVDEAVAELPEKYRIPLVIHCFEGKTHKEVAAQLRVSTSTAANRVQRGVERVRRILKRKGVLAPAAMLAAMLDETAAQAAPASLIAALGHLAVAGTAGTVPAAATSAAGAATSLIGGILMAKKIAVVAGIALVSAIVIFTARTVSDRRAEPQAVRQYETQSSSSPSHDSPMRVTVKVYEGDASQPHQQLPVLPKPAEKIAADDPAAPAASVSGMVTNQGAPFPGANVLLLIAEDEAGYYRREEMRATTGADGRYVFDDVKTFGYAYVTAAAAGYLGNPETGHRFGLSAGTSKRDADFEMQPCDFVVAGHVVGPDRRPLVGARVGLVHCGYTEEDIAIGNYGHGSSSNVSAMTRQLTDDKGYFEMAISQEGLCDFMVAMDGYGPGFFQQVPTGTRDAVFMLRQGASVSGRAIWHDGTPVSGALIELLGSAGGAEKTEFLCDSRVMRADAEGAFQFGNVGEGLKYSLTAQNPAKEPPLEALRMAELINKAHKHEMSAVKEFEVREGQQLTGIELVLAPTTEIKGRVTTKENGKPAFPLRLSATMDGEVTRSWTDTKEDGAYSLSVDIAEASEIIVGYAYSNFAGTDGYTEAGRVKVEPGETAELNFSVPGSVDVPVRFVDEQGRPFPGLFATLHEPGTGSFRGLQQVEPDGTTVLRHINPNKQQQVLAVAAGQSPLYGASAPFVCRPGETQPEVTVVCRAIAGIKARFLMPDGNPPPPGNFSLGGRNATGYWISLGVDSDEEGYLEIKDAIQEGQYSEITFLTLLFGKTIEESTYYAATAKDVELTAGTITDLGTLTLAQVTEEQFDNFMINIGQ